MSNEELTILVLDKLGWDYDKELNPNRYTISKPIWAGILIQAILETNSIPEASSKIGFAYKAVNTSIARFFIPVFGKLNGGNEGWRFKLMNFIEYKKCPSCNVIKHYSKFHKNKHDPTNTSSKCKHCRIQTNSLMYDSRKLRVPKWFETEKLNIADFYEQCPEGYHVDHIIPLQGRKVSGLHTISNLQYLTKEENVSKGNHYSLD